MPYVPPRNPVVRKKAYTRLLPYLAFPLLVVAAWILFYIYNSLVLLAAYPSVTGTAPGNNASGVFRNTAVSVDVSLPNEGAGVEGESLTPTHVRLLRTDDRALVPGVINTSGGGDAIVFQPSVLLDASTSYRFEITEGVKDESGKDFVPFEMTFKTGDASSIGPTPGVSFTASQVYSGAALTSLVIGPDSKLYAAGIDGSLRRWAMDSVGNLSNMETFTGLAGRIVVGLLFDVADPRVLWVSHNDAVLPEPSNRAPKPGENVPQLSDDFTGKVSKLTLSGAPGFGAVAEDYIIGLPRSTKDHLTNSLAFGPDGLLYLSQGSNSAMGAIDPVWHNRPERLLNATVLQIDPSRTPPAGGFNVQTEDYKNRTGDYDPFAIDAPVKIYATGIRNAYDLLWHSNGQLYVPANGSAAGGNTPASPPGVTPSVPAVKNGPTQDDYLFKIVQGGYYGHPNPLRGQYVMNGGNPTSMVDPAEMVSRDRNSGYPEGVKPDANYRGFIWNFGRNRSPNGVIEYQSDTFAGALKHKMLVAEYSAGDDILALSLDERGNIAQVTQVISGLSDPLDLIEDPRNGNLYVAELIDRGASGRLSLLSPALEKATRR